ncbi:GEM-like protein 4 isoform X2 [Ziziphus jujuba]|uniref:GEM-like protein 4 isoform X2 n=1 Tax=Ziziphus jujuba TaxID=326968 RepID=A0A6P3ZXV4_ZIZJJ|nr:GEM-like protein 4 isoform X2 [Ziziphus jujuba]
MVKQISEKGLALYQAERSPMVYSPRLPASSHFHGIPSPVNGLSNPKQSREDSVLNWINMIRTKTDNFARGIQRHVRFGSKITEAVKGRLSMRARIIQVGGAKKFFRKSFTIREGEELLKTCKCNISTTAGPISGLLFISTHKVAFCSEKPIKFSSPKGDFLRAYYKVVIPIKRIKRVDQSENVKQPSQKYIDIVTVDDFEFWFMGFLNYQKTLKYLQQEISQGLN